MLRMLRSENSVWLIVVNHTVTAAVLLPYMFYLGVWPDGRQLAVLAVFGFVQMGIPYVLFARGMKMISSQEASGIVLLEPVLTPIWLLVPVWGEVPAWWTIVGGGLILVGLAVRYAWPWREKGLMIDDL